MFHDARGKGWELQKDAESVTGTGQDWYYHWKADELKRVNKSELVPTLISVDPETHEADETKVCTENETSSRTKPIVLPFNCSILFFVHRLSTKVWWRLTSSTM